MLAPEQEAALAALLEKSEGTQGIEAHASLCKEIVSALSHGGSFDLLLERAAEAEMAGRGRAGSAGACQRSTDALGPGGRALETFRCPVCRDTGYVAGHTRVRFSRVYASAAWCLSCEVGLGCCAGHFAARIWPWYSRQPNKARRAELEAFQREHAEVAQRLELRVDDCLKRRGRLAKKQEAER